MRKLIVILFCMSLVLGLSTAALADPVLTQDGYTVYLGESNHLYLRDPEGVTKVLRHPIRDLVSINETELFCLTEAGQLYGIMLDASGTRIVSAAPEIADLAVVAMPTRFVLADGLLSLVHGDGTVQQLSESALVACATDTAVYYVETVDNQTRLMVCARQASVSQLLTPAPHQLKEVPANIVSITATEDAIAMVKDDHSILTLNLADNSTHEFPANADTTTIAVSIGNKLIRLHEDEQSSGYVVESTSEEGIALASEPAVTPSTTLAPTAAPKPTATPKLTATPKPASSASSSNEDDGRIRYGATGSEVRKMQKKLAALGYPVGTVDGDFGKNTLRAVHLFQSAIGYTERSYASASMLKKLYASSAPAYDRYCALSSGDKGENVEILQEMLFYLGYLGKDDDEIDGKYGPITIQGVKAFQKTWNIEPADGKATKATLEELCALYDEFLQTGKVPKPSPTPSVVPPVPPADDNTGSGDTGSGDTGSGDTGSGDTGSGDTGSGDTGSGDTGSGDTGSGDTGSGDTGSGDTGSGDTGSGDTGSGDTGSGDTGSGDTGSGDTGSGDTGSGDTGSGDTGSGDTGSGDTGSGDTGSEDVETPTSPTDL